MLTRLIWALALMSLCVAIHAGGVTSALRWVRRRPDTAAQFWSVTRLFILVAGWMVLLHLFEISAWAAFYVWQRALADMQSALYFSAVTYTTTGYGDVVLPGDWRLLGGVEALTGILMCGWSTGFFFAIMDRIYQRRDGSSSPARNSSGATDAVRVP